MGRDDYVRQGKQFASDVRDTVGRRVSENEGSLRDTVGKAARWVDEKTGGKYSGQIGRAQGKVGEGIGWVAAQDPDRAPGGPSTGTPGAPGAAAADPTEPRDEGEPGSGPTGPTGPVGPTAP